MEWIDYFNLLILVHLILQLFFGIFISFKSFQLLMLKKISSKASPTMILYFYFLTTLGSFLAIYSIYAIIFWRPDIVLADPVTLYIFGFLPWILICVNSVIEFCLCLERIFVVSFPYQYLERSKNAMSAGTFILLIICITLNIWLNDLAKLPQQPQPICRFFTCFTVFMPKPFLLPYKIVICVLEGAAAIFLLVFVKCKIHASIYAKSKSRNHAMLIIIFTTIICEFTPNLIDLIISSIFNGMSLVFYIGPYVTTLSCISITINILIFCKVFNKRRIKNISIQVIPAATTTSSRTKQFTKNLIKIFSH